MPYGTNDFMSLLYEYVKTEDGQQTIEESAVKNFTGGPHYSRAAMKQIAGKLKNEIISTFLSIVKDSAATFNYGDVRVSTTRVVDNRWTVTVTFGDRALYRPSLFNPSTWEQTGNGVDDIFELFTHGVNYPYYVYGVWMRGDGTGQLTDAPNSRIVQSCRKRIANDFINRIIAKYQTMFPGVTFLWPTEWGGNN